MNFAILLLINDDVLVNVNREIRFFLKKYY